MRSYSLCASLVLAVSSQAQAPQDPRDSFQCKSAYAAFQRDTPGPWTVQWHPATLTPSAIYGQGLPIEDWRENSLEEARRHANNVLVQYHDLLGLGTSEFREIIGARMGRSWSFTFDQFFHSLPVIEGRADVRINMRGVVAMMGSRAWPIPANFDTTPQIGEEVATAIAWQQLETPLTGVPQPAAIAAPRLVIWGDIDATDVAPFYLAWEVSISNVDRNGFGPIGRYYIDAKTGGVLHYQNDKHTCGNPACTNPHHGVNRLETIGPIQPGPVTLTTVTVMAWTRTGLDGQSALVNTALRGLVLNVPGVGQVTTDANGQFTIDIAAPVSISVGALDGTHFAPIAGTNAPSGSFTVTPGVNSTIQLLTSGATTNEAAHTTAAYWIDRTNEWARSILGTSGSIPSAMNTISGIAPTVNQSGTCNAYYTGNTLHFYPAGGGCANTAFSTVVAHEWGHGLDDRFGGISNASNDGLSEGWGDIMGLYISDTPNLGSGFQTAGVPLRSGNNTKLYGTQNEVHNAGEIWMGFAWKYRENLRAAFGTNLAIQISNDTVITSIVADATNQADAVREVFIADDDDGNLNNGVPHYAQLSAAAITKGMPYPQIQIISIAHAPLGNTSARLTPRIVAATIAAVSSGTVTQTRLFYNAGAGAQVRNMHPTNAPNGYSAMLPGIMSGAVSYHIEAVHSGGTTVRLPVTGEYTYVVSVPPTGPFIGFYSESFDTGAAGWSHGRYSTTGTDDWQLGAPNGKSSTVSGVFWSDPASAVSGSSVYGTDLGAGTSNGRYPNSIDYYLRSPTINCSGRTGVTLRFKRWLTVEEGIYDQATILVNGVQIWTNPANGHLVDSSWQTLEYPIPVADNNPAVQVEFRLTADGGLNLGGWQIDDVELGTRTTTPLDAELTMLPEQAAQGSPMTLVVSTQGSSRPYLLALGDTTGPTLVPGFPIILVGGSGLAVLGGATNALGLDVINFTAPSVPSAIGVVYFSQVLTVNSTFTAFVTSNLFLNLFTQTP
ncbi:MAG TPA: hypothetical protein VFZ65_00115 [Planctomycetota bacterium]|nr:hypothetical protein [Planctomycetota bacterium]